MFRFVNEDFENSWGVARGYGIFHGMTTSQLLPDTHPLTRCAARVKGFETTRDWPFTAAFGCVIIFSPYVMQDSIIHPPTSGAAARLRTSFPRYIDAVQYCM